MCGARANGLNLQGTIAGVDDAARRDREGWSNPILNIYTTADGRNILISVQNIARDFPRLLEVLGKAEWLQDETMQPVKPLFRNRFKARNRLLEAFAEIDAESLCAGLDAETACAWGLVNRVLPPEELLPDCKQLAIDICSAEPITLKEVHHLIDYGSEYGLSEGLKRKLLPQWHTRKLAMSAQIHWKCGGNGF